MKRIILLFQAVVITMVLTFFGLASRAEDKSTSVEASATVLKHRYSFSTDASDSVGHADGTLVGAASISSGQVHLKGTRGTYVNLPGGLIAGYPAVTF